MDKCEKFREEMPSYYCYTSCWHNDMILDVYVRGKRAQECSLFACFINSPESINIVHTFLNVRKLLGGHAKNSATSPLLM